CRTCPVPPSSSSSWPSSCSCSGAPSSPSWPGRSARRRPSSRSRPGRTKRPTPPRSFAATVTRRSPCRRPSSMPSSSSGSRRPSGT
ncbi:MAG: hypothetical protein AVDCRST_MAG76-1284, partial [uncultured Acidimicrobiales bacterium]